ncbi:Hypothetical protein HVR_LOCUS964 [uncultured virus]|nr:Hypothetical protein HVR_LOCUS964 [uncultured virus]
MGIIATRPITASRPIVKTFQVLEPLMQEKLPYKADIMVNSRFLFAKHTDKISWIDAKPSGWYYRYGNDRLWIDVCGGTPGILDLSVPISKLEYSEDQKQWIKTMINGTQYVMNESVPYWAVAGD